MSPLVLMPKQGVAQVGCKVSPLGYSFLQVQYTLDLLLWSFIFFDHVGKHFPASNCMLSKCSWYRINLLMCFQGDCLSRIILC